MSTADNAIERRAITRATLGPGVVLGSLGILGFSFVPGDAPGGGRARPVARRFGRATVAAVLAAAYLRATRAPRPTRAQVRARDRRARRRGRLPAVHARSRCEDETAAHGAVVIAFLPAATAVAAVLRAGERPPRFWLASAAGCRPCSRSPRRAGPSGSGPRAPTCSCSAPGAVRDRLRGGRRAVPRPRRREHDLLGAGPRRAGHRHRRGRGGRDRPTPARPRGSASPTSP